ncbi:MAG: PIN domain-containing protein [Sphingomonas sp.]|uniref:PIN domain-containing protein n=1 Tax=Sphingomonas sp. TaxID=28214 RepID=UPI001B0BF544|nr:PIN domain-containing protein [Sphingomonas sp.]MBO9623663.1 PIN domain-containing protein [Sphingomonas sp.]
MAVMIDTNVAIHLRDGDPAIGRRLVERGEALVISVVTRVELEGGTAASNDPLRRPRLERMLQTLTALPFTDAEAAAYGAIIAALGHDRRRVLDRMIAAQAIVADLPLVTINGPDFRDIPGLKLETWDDPARA